MARKREARIIYEGDRAWNGQHADGLAHIEVRTGAQGQGKKVWEKAYNPETNWYDQGIEEARAFCRAQGYREA